MSNKLFSDNKNYPIWEMVRLCYSRSISQ